MKFVSKLSRYRITLRQGIPGNPLMAIPAKSGLYALFTDGQFFTDDEEIISLLKKNPRHKKDYFAVEAEEADPFKGVRRDTEPAHQVMEMGQGERPGKIVTPPAKSGGKSVKTAAEELLKELMPTIVSRVRAEVTAEMEAKATAENAPAKETTTKKEAPAKAGKVKKPATAEVDEPSAK